MDDGRDNHYRFWSHYPLALDLDAGFAGIWRVVMDYAISPRVMGHQLEIHPLLAIFTVMAGGAVGGIAGIYLSIPLVATLRVVWRRLPALRNTVVS